MRKPSVTAISIRCLLAAMILLAGAVVMAQDKEELDASRFEGGTGHGYGIDISSVKGYYCDNLASADDWFVVYSTSTLTGHCWDITLTPSSGDPDLYAMWSVTVSSNPPGPFDTSNYECGRSRNSGTAVDSYDMCSHCCYTYGQIREYVVAYSAPTSFCINNDWYTCSPGLRLSSLTTRRLDSQIEIAWSTTGEPNIAGYNLNRRLGEDGEWVRVNPSLISTSSDSQYQVLDQLVEPDHVRYYRLDQVTLEGEQQQVGMIVDRPPAK